MKISVFLSVFSVFLSVTACKTQKPVVTVPLETKTIIKERLIEVQTPADSAWLTAYLECDSNFNVLLKSFDEHATTRMNTSLKVDTGTLSYQVIRIRDKIYIPAKDSIIYQEVPVPVEIPVEVNRLTGWQYFQIWAGRIALILLVIVALWSYFMPKPLSK